MSPNRPRASRRAALQRAALVLTAVFLLSGCAAFRGATPAPTPLDFPGIAGQLALHGIAVGSPIAGDAGCTDATLIPTAIGFDAAGLDQAATVRVRVYIFRNRETYERRRPDVDTCVAAWATDPATLEFVDASPFVVAVQGPIGSRFKAALRESLTVAAGNGG